MPLTTTLSSETATKRRPLSGTRRRRASRARRPSSRPPPPSIPPTVTAATTVTASETLPSDNQLASFARASGSQGNNMAAARARAKPAKPVKPAKPAKRASFQLHSASVSIPHPAKRATHGEDASLQTPTAIGVFDGVGSWSRRRVNAGDYSRRLADLVTAYLARHRSATPQRALADAVSRNVLPGSCTATVASVLAKDKSYFLQGVNLGDAQLVVIRSNAVLFQTASQQHGFNVPYQVSFAKRHDLFSAQLFEVKLKPNDVIVLATDGLWDNVFLADIVSTVTAAMSEKSFYESSQKLSARPVRSNVSRQNKLDEDQTIAAGSSRQLCTTSSSRRRLQAAAESLAYTACRNAHQRSLMSPFAYKARRFGRRFSGGKLDDITVVVAQPVMSYESVCTFLEASCPRRKETKHSSKLK